jgi:hypothetical protein
MSRADLWSLIDLLLFQLAVLLPFGLAAGVYIWRTRGR